MARVDLRSKGLVEAVAREKATLRKKKISDGWFRRFMERQPYLRLRKGDATANVRMDYVNKETMTECFDLLKNVLSEHGLMNLPNQIYNVDETGMPLEHRPPKVVTKKAKKKLDAGRQATGVKLQSLSVLVLQVKPFHRL